MGVAATGPKFALWGPETEYPRPMPHAGSEPRPDGRTILKRRNCAPKPHRSPAIRNTSCLLAGLLTAGVALIPHMAQAQPPPVQVVLFTHIEDNTPGGLLGSAQNRQSYMTWRSRLIGVGTLMHDHGLPWSLQPDWKILECALLYEDSTVMQTTNGKNLFRYLHEDLGTIIDPHSHENGGYNYTDVAHLIDSLGVEPTTVIGGHVWDPSLPQFQEWDRYRVPVPGQRFPWALWRGDILMGSGTPFHVDDPVVSGVWQPQDRDHYFTHDGQANIAAIGQYKGTMEDIPELAALYQSGAVGTPFMLTSSYGIRPLTIQRPDGLVSIADSVVAPMTAWRDLGMVMPTDFTALVETWRSAFGSRGFFYDAETPATDASVFDSPPARLEPSFPNPFRAAVALPFTVSRAGWVRLTIYDVDGRRVAAVVNEAKAPGRYSPSWSARGLSSGVYFCELRTQDGAVAAKRRLLLVR